MGKILTILIFLIVLIAFFVWLSGGGLARIRAYVPAYQNPVGSFFEQQKGKPVAYTAESLAPATPKIGASSGQRISSSGTTQITRAQVFGDPSPYRGVVTFDTRLGYNNTSEYVIIRANTNNTAPVTISGWSLGSATSKTQTMIPKGIPTYRMGSISTLVDIALLPGEEAIIVSGPSPVGTSFRTNACIGYLAQFQTFTPSLSNSCPTPRTELPNTTENQSVYGASCIEFVASLPSCTYHLGSFPPNLSDQCRAFVTNALSYNSCVDRHQFEAQFAGRTWRVYLGSSTGLWNKSSDVIRLLDSTGRTVDAVSY